MAGNENSEVKELSEFIAKDFKTVGLDQSIMKAECADLAEFRLYLRGKLAVIMEENFDLLIKTLYRIDIGEEKLQKLFAPDNREYIPSALTEMIIERQMEKIRTRKLYKNEK